MAPIAAIYKVGDKFRARVLFGDTLSPVEFIMQTDERDVLSDALYATFAGVNVVTQHRFQMELDFAKKFGMRWNAESYALESQARMSDEQIKKTLDQIDDVLDKTEEKFNAIFSSSIVDD